MRDRGRMTLSDLARRTGVSRATLYRVASGQGDPSLHTLRAMKGALGCSWQDLLGP